MLKNAKLYVKAFTTGMRDTDTGAQRNPAKRVASYRIFCG